MASRSVQVAMFLLIFRIVLGANRVIRTQQPKFKRAPDRIMDAPAHLDQAAERSFRI